MAVQPCRRLSIVDRGRSADRLAERTRADRTSCSQGLAWSGPRDSRTPAIGLLLAVLNGACAVGCGPPGHPPQHRQRHLTVATSNPSLTDREVIIARTGLPGGGSR